MPPLPTVAIHTPLPEGSAAQLVRAYHERTKHRLTAFAQGPQTLDWDAQPAAFRHFDGAARLRLPLLGELADDDAVRRAYARPFAWPPAAELEPPPWGLSALGCALQLSLGITAHKSLGPDRWAVRANPSSGNLHPVEAYVVARGLPTLTDGVYHYAPDAHALEHLARWARPGPSAKGLFIALSCVQWRETWKYGERAFRYCQLDTGHAIGALQLAFAPLGGQLRAVGEVDSLALAELLGVEPGPAGLRASEREEPELVMQVCLPSLPGPCDPAELLSTRGLVREPLTPSTIDPRPVYAWPLVDLVAQATRAPASAPSAIRAREKGALEPPVPAPDPAPGRSLGDVVASRRSAQRFDIRYTLPQRSLVALLQAARRSEPWVHSALGGPTRLDLVLFVHRVEGLSPGLYFMPCAARPNTSLHVSLRAAFEVSQVGGQLESLGLWRLAEIAPRELMRRARLVHCQQDIASSSCLAIGMLGPLAEAVECRPSAYRTLHREAGLVGQALYLQAEALGLRGTGIGCFLDDEVHALLRLASSDYQTLYHFTVGRALDDLRIESGPAYPDRARE